MMNTRSSIIRPLLLALLTLTPLATVCGNTADRGILAEIFDPGFLQGDCSYHSIVSASNGRIYFTIGTHHTDYSARLYSFDPSSDSLREELHLNAALGEDPSSTVPHGKVHTPLIEENRWLYFTTHTSTYDDMLPDRSPDSGRKPYPGGHFVRYNLDNGSLESLARIPLANEGLITMDMDRRNRQLVALTWPSGILFTYDLETSRLEQFGAVQGRGEWGQFGQDWNFICRRLGVTPDGQVYGSSNNGSIWRFDAGDARPLTVLDGLSLDSLPPVSEQGFTISDEPHYFWRNWRTILWNPNTESFWGLHGGSTQLFEFQPDAGLLRSVVNLRADGLPQSRRNPYRTQLGFCLGPDNTLYYLAHGPAIHKPGRRDPTANVHLVTYDINRDKRIDHGPVIGPDDRRVFFAESIAVGPEGRLYAVAWVETLDADRKQAIQESRGQALPAETREILYEIQLIRLPMADAFTGS